MRRTYTRERYLDRVALIREHVPDCALTTDVIVGFPGETEDDFEQTLTLVEQVGYDGAFTFIYSPRRGTEAAELHDPLPHEAKVERMERLVEVVQRRARERAQRFVGRTLDVLVEGTSRTDPSRLRGRTRHNKVGQLRRPGAAPARSSRSRSRRPPARRWPASSRWWSRELSASARAARRAAADALRTPSCTLRPLAAGDLDRLVATVSAPGVREWWGPADRRGAPARGTAQRGPRVRGRGRRRAGRLAGLRRGARPRLLVRQHGHASSRPPTRTAGSVRAALRLVARWLLDERGHHRLTIDPAVANDRAIRAYTGLGFRPVGVMRGYERGHDGRWHDNLLMDLLAGELARRVASPRPEPRRRRARGPGSSFNRAGDRKTRQRDGGAAVLTLCEHVFVRWDNLQIEAEEARQLPGYRDPARVRTFDAPEALDTRFYEVRAKSAINRVPERSRMPFRFTINPYRGCSHACVFCFARPTHTYLDFDAGRDFEREIVVKVNAPELVRAEVSRPRGSASTSRWARTPTPTSGSRAATG